jgi:hypothetical protein
MRSRGSAAAGVPARLLDLLPQHSDRLVALAAYDEQPHA